MTGEGSLWSDTLGREPVRRPPLDQRRADVVIVGGGYTGLWTAYHLLRLDPTLEVVVIEKQTVGFGASGRNGGWCQGELSVGLDRLRAASDAATALRMARMVFDTVDRVGAVCREEGIDCDFAKGGTVRVARTRRQLERQHASVEHGHAAGLGDADIRILDRDEAAARLGASRVLGGVHFAHTAALHPAKLVQGLADVVERRGGVIAEGTTVTAIEPGRAVTDHGPITARAVLRATEAYTGDLGGAARRIMPMYTLMVATEPLDDETWRTIGLPQRETFTDERHMVVYGQRTADDRIAFGGCGVPYAYGGRIAPRLETKRRLHQRIEGELRSLLPPLERAAITHRWGGPVGMPRDWFPAVAFDPATGLGHAGGYVGQGVAASHLAGHTLAELALGRDTARTQLPWVGHRWRRWEPEPLRWLGVKAAHGAVTSADRAEARGRRSRLADQVLRQVR